MNSRPRIALRAAIVDLDERLTDLRADWRLLLELDDDQDPSGLIREHVQRVLTGLGSAELHSAHIRHQLGL